jgi:hypothetical protein
VDRAGREVGLDPDMAVDVLQGPCDEPQAAATARQAGHVEEMHRQDP